MIHFGLGPFFWKFQKQWEHMVTIKVSLIFWSKIQCCFVSSLRSPIPNPMHRRPPWYTFGPERTVIHFITPFLSPFSGSKGSKRIKWPPQWIWVSERRSIRPAGKAWDMKTEQGCQLGNKTATSLALSEHSIEGMQKGEGMGNKMAAPVELQSRVTRFGPPAGHLFHPLPFLHSWCPKPPLRPFFPHSPLSTSFHSCTRSGLPGWLFYFLSSIPILFSYPMLRKPDW